MEASTGWFVGEFGSRETLAVALRLYEDSHSDIADPDVAATWGELSIWIGGRNVCEHRSASGEHDAILWHFLEMLEWLATNWDPVLHEERLPDRNEGIDAAQGMRLIARRLRFDDDLDGFARWQRWWERHCLCAARGGGLFPSLYLRRRRGEIELSWDSRRLDYAPAGFGFLAEAGHEYIAPADAETALWGLLDGATSVLQRRWS